MRISTKFLPTVESLESIKLLSGVVSAAHLGHAHKLPVAEPRASIVGSVHGTTDFFDLLVHRQVVLKDKDTVLTVGLFRGKVEVIGNFSEGNGTVQINGVDKPGSVVLALGKPEPSPFTLKYSYHVVSTEGAAFQYAQGDGTLTVQAQDARRDLVFVRMTFS